MTRESSASSVRRSTWLSPSIVVSICSETTGQTPPAEQCAAVFRQGDADVAPVVRCYLASQQPALRKRCDHTPDEGPFQHRDAT